MDKRSARRSPHHTRLPTSRDAARQNSWAGRMAGIGKAQTGTDRTARFREVRLSAGCTVVKIVTRKRFVFDNDKSRSSEPSHGQEWVAIGSA